MNKLELTSLNCASCGASLSDYQGKETIICECGSEIRQVRKNDHYKSVKHQNYILSQIL